MANKKIIDLTTRVPSVSDWAIFYNEATNKTYKALVSAFSVAGTGIVQTIFGGTGISVNSTNPLNPIITNTLPDQTVSITAGTNITSVTGTYPNFTINAATQVGGTGDMVLASAQTNSGIKTFLNGTIGLRNILNTITSFFANSSTVARTWTFPDKDGTVAMTSDITGINSGTNTGDETTSTLGATINAAVAATPNDTDLVTTVDTSVVKKITWTNVKAFLKTYFDTVYAQLAGSVSQAFTVASLELGHATDTTLSRVSAGVIAVEGVTVATATNTLTMSGKTLTTPAIASLKGTLTTDTDGVTITFDKNVSDFHNVVLGGNRTLALSNMVAGDRIVLRLTQDATGTRTVTWFTTIKWAGGTVPTLTTTINKADMFGFLCTSAGNYDGFIIGQNI